MIPQGGPATHSPAVPTAAAPAAAPAAVRRDSRFELTY